MLTQKTPKSIFIQDTTLRDGLQAPGLELGFYEKLELAQEIADAGVDEIEAGFPARGSRERKWIKLLLKQLDSTPVRQWCRTHQTDLKAAVEIGCRHIHMSVPISDPILSTLSWTWPETLNKLRLFYRRYSPYFESLSLGIQDISRCPVSRLRDFANLAQELSVPRIRLADTVGLLTPWSLSSVLEPVRTDYGGQIEFHAHNDCGLATANALTALMQGADGISATINGVGERAGNAVLGEVVFLIEREASLKSSCSAAKVLALSHFFAALIRQPVRNQQPLVGSHVFRHTSRIHVSSLRRNPESYQPFPPSSIPGQRMRLN